MKEHGGYVISGDMLFFFDKKPAALPLYDDELMGWIKEAADFSAGKR